MRRKSKKIYIFLIMFVLFGVSVGYAAINRTLNITGNTEVTKNTWNLYFDKINITEGSVRATSDAAINDSSINFSISLDLPGDFYEFTVEVVNDGTIDAMIDSVVKTPTLTAAQTKYLNYIIEYQNGEQINSKQLVKAKEFVRLKVRVEYRSDITEFDLPTVTETLNLGFTINYVQADTTGVAVLNNGSSTEFVYIEEVQLEFEPGMNWGDLILSGYNDGKLEMDSYGYITYDGIYFMNGSASVYYSDLIDNSIIYEFSHLGGGGI